MTENSKNAIEKYKKENSKGIYIRFYSSRYDILEGIQARAAALGISPGAYLKQLAEKDLQAAGILAESLEE